MYGILKRATDIALSAVALFFLWPILLIIAVVIRVDSPGSPFFLQTRVGRDGREFQMIKFRTMFADNDESKHRDYMEKHVRGETEPRQNEEGQEVYLLDDERVTRVGRFLRRTSIDELPNLINVLAGSMSIVGPRPPIPYEVEHYDERARRRLTVKPGMTGYAQIRGRGSLTFQDMVDHDLEYIDDRSLGTDFKIIIGTIPAVVRKRGV